MSMRFITPTQPEADMIDAAMTQAASEVITNGERLLREQSEAEMKLAAALQAIIAEVDTWRREWSKYSRARLSAEHTLDKIYVIADEALKAAEVDVAAAERT